MEQKASDDEVMVLQNYAFEYHFCNAPLFFIKPQSFDSVVFDVKFHQAMYSAARYLRQHPDTSPDAIAAPHLYGLTYGEMAMLYLLARYTRRKSATKKTTKNEEEEEAKGSHHKKICRMTTKLRQRYLYSTRNKSKIIQLKKEEEV